MGPSHSLSHWGGQTRAAVAKSRVKAAWAQTTRKHRRTWPADIAASGVCSLHRKCATAQGMCPLQGPCQPRWPSLRPARCRGEVADAEHNKSGTHTVGAGG